jgi:hypothetical protein
VSDVQAPVGISPVELAATYPRLYHMADTDAWPGIAAHGLLSTAAIFEKCAVPAGERRRLQAKPRSDLVRFTANGHQFIVRDQKPLNDKKLARCLIDMTVPEWLAMLDSRVYFWPTEKRVRTLLNARAYRGRRHLVIAVDTAQLLDRHGEAVELSPINSGSTAYDAKPRGSRTFLPLAEYPFEERRRIRGRREAVAEVTVRYAVPQIDEMITGRWLADTQSWQPLE